MAKQKKRKTEHVSDAEIWDDSALIRSWDAAVAEYEVSYPNNQVLIPSDWGKYYHSIHARGEDVEEVLRQAEMAEKTNSKASLKTNGNHVEASASEGIDAYYEDGEIGDEDLEESKVSAEKGDGAAHESYNAAPVLSATNGNGHLNGHHPNATMRGNTYLQR